MMTGCGVIFRHIIIVLGFLLPDVAGAAEGAATLGQQGEDELAALVMAIAKVSGALAVVVGLMFLTLYVMKKLDLGRGRFSHGSLIEVLDTRMIAPRKYISVVNIGGQLLALGVSEQHISMLARLDPEVISAPKPEGGGDVGSTQGTPLAKTFAALLTRAGLNQKPKTEAKDGEGHA